MSLSVARAMQLLHELVEIDSSRRGRRQPLSMEQKFRRRDICRQLNHWALERQRLAGGGAERREHARAPGPMQLGVDLLRASERIGAELDSLAVGGVSLIVAVPVKVGETLTLRLVPEPPDQQVELEGDVVWFDAGRSRAGLRFGKMGEEAQALLERLVFGGLLAAKQKY
jgi:hypothetical protein